MPQDDAATREQKAWRRITAASRKLAKQTGDAELGEQVASANHQDDATRSMRRMEALATLLEAAVADSTPAEEPTKSSKRVKADDHESARTTDQ